MTKKKQFLSIHNKSHMYALNTKYLWNKWRKLADKSVIMVEDFDILFSVIDSWRKVKSIRISKFWNTQLTRLTQYINIDTVIEIHTDTDIGIDLSLLY